jgi:hypothetical protein
MVGWGGVAPRFADTSPPGREESAMPEPQPRHRPDRPSIWKPRSIQWACRIRAGTVRIRKSPGSGGILHPSSVSDTLCV